jgi:large subunit ribosomal protein L14e
VQHLFPTGDQGKDEDDRMIEIGRVCVKLAGRDAGKKCVIIDILDDHRVMIAGETRKRACNVEHLEPTNATVSIKKGASVADIAEACKGAGMILRETKPKKAAPRQKPQPSESPATKQPVKTRAKKPTNTKK